MEKETNKQKTLNLIKVNDSIIFYLLAIPVLGAVIYGCGLLVGDMQVPSQMKPVTFVIIAFLSLALPATYFTIILLSRIFKVKNAGKLVLLENAVILVNKEKINLNDSYQITFKYLGDHHWKSRFSPWQPVKASHRYLNWKEGDPKNLFDYIKIDGKIYFLKIQNKSDMQFFFFLAREIHRLTGKVTLINARQ